MPCNNSSNGSPWYDGPFYDGPFPGAAPVDTRRRPCRPGNNGSSNGNGNGNGNGNSAAAYAFFYQTGRLNIGGGGAIPFNGRAACDRNIRLEDGEITLRFGGTYAVAYALTVPESYTLSTGLSLTLDGDAVPGSALAVEKNTTSNSMTFSSQVIMDAEAGAQLSLVSQAPVDIAAGCPDIIATLSVHRL